MNEAYSINKATGTTFWCNTIQLEMENVCVVFDVLVHGVTLPPDRQYMCCCMIFFIKMEGFGHKAWFVTGRHMTKAVATFLYAKILSEETLHTAILVVMLTCGPLML